MILCVNYFVLIRAWRQSCAQLVWIWRPHGLYPKLNHVIYRQPWHNIWHRWDYVHGVELILPWVSTPPGWVLLKLCHRFDADYTKLSVPGGFPKVVWQVWCQWDQALCPRWFLLKLCQIWCRWDQSSQSWVGSPKVVSQVWCQWDQVHDLKHVVLPSVGTVWHTWLAEGAVVVPEIPNKNKSNRSFKCSNPQIPPIIIHNIKFFLSLIILD